ncbi:carbohydrate ABC transporter permease [Vallitalea okinawensis]|uniref:carbohydrate ABC transporter permease n=1 Tax=Vallitalea okinawensis TaxID=2078660 RepID=UPI000CFA9FE1|nr:sugar ABC transporter permease [Vallitalea okinawensis]
MKKKQKLVKYDKYGYLFVAPFILAFLIFQLYPIIYTFQLSFTDLAGWETELNYVGFKNYVTLLSNELFLKAFRNTWIIWILNFIPQIGMALILVKWFTDARLKLKGAGFFKVTFYMPNIITAASVAVLFSTLFSYPSGPINLLLVKFGVLEEPFEFFRSVTATRGIVAFIQFWMWYGNTFIILTAGALGINRSLYEAAMVDGATSGQMFRKITLPLLKPITLYVLVTSLIGGMQMFDIPFLLTTQGNPDYSIETMTMFIYRQAFLGGRNYYFAATASVILLCIILIVSILLFKVMNSKTTGDRKARRRIRKAGVR